MSLFGKIPLASVGLVLGSVLLVIGVIAYVAHNATLNLAGFFYGFPLILGGLALKVGELKPIPFSEPTTPEVLALRTQQATVTQNKLRTDVTRYVYGQDVHLDEALKVLGLSRTKEERPILIGLREISIDNAYTLILEFDSPHVPLELWQQKEEKMTSYFGPGVKIAISQPQNDRIDISLICT